MRTNIDLDDALLAEAMAASGLKTKKATLEAALRQFILHKRELETLTLFGTVDWQSDLDTSRLGRETAP